MIWCVYRDNSKLTRRRQYMACDVRSEQIIPSQNLTINNKTHIKRAIFKRRYEDIYTLSLSLHAGI